jgi:hypothetical protein
VYRIAEFPDRNQWLARNCADCTRCPRAEGFGQKLLTSTGAADRGTVLFAGFAVGCRGTAAHTEALIAATAMLG